MRNFGSFGHLVWTTVLSRISGITRHHLAICITSLWTSSYYQKRHILQSCATPALILCSFLHFGTTSQRALLPLSLLSAQVLGNLTACTWPVTPGAASPVGAFRAPAKPALPSRQLRNRASTQKAPLCSCMACDFYFVRNSQSNCDPVGPLKVSLVLF